MRFFENVFFTLVEKSLVDLFNSVDDCKQSKGPRDMLPQKNWISKARKRNMAKLNSNI